MQPGPMRSATDRAVTVHGRHAIGLFGAVVAAALLCAASLLVRGGSARALIVCQSHSNSADELQLRALISNWRVQYVPNTDPGSPLVISAPLNAAAYGYARYLSDHVAASGHGADGQTAIDRAIQCGYPAAIAAGDESVAVLHGSPGVDLTPQQALDTMAAESYYEAHMRVPNQLGAPLALPLRCIGIAKATSADGKGVAWVAMFMGSSDNTCPQTVDQTTNTVEPTFPGFSTKTPTPTPTATKSAHATRTPDLTHAHIAQIAVDAPDERSH
jgi:uncharacterized protein YkwD